MRHADTSQTLRVTLEKHAKSKQTKMEIKMEIDLQDEITSKQRLGSCEVCHLVQSKYTCPRCEIKTCSLKCSKNHKTENECDGIRDRTKYKPLKQMTSMDFMNDYYFLEEATRFTKEIKCNKSVKNPNRLNFRFMKLKKEAFSRNTKLYFVNNGLTKRMKNQTVYKAQQQTIYWHLELVFPNAGNFTVNKKYSENLKVQEILMSVLNSKTQDPLEKQLDFYRAENPNKLRMMLKAEGLKKSNNRYFEMDLKKSLKANLTSKVIIEYPTIYVLIGHSADDFDVIASDDESVETELKDFRKTLHEEVFSKKIGINPPLILKPEEIPIISEVVNDNTLDESRDTKIPAMSKVVDNQGLESDDEVQPVNYLFSTEF